MKGTITKIEQQKRHSDRFNIYVDDEYVTSVHEDVLVKSRLSKGQSLQDDEWMELLAQEEEAKAKQRALSYVSYKPRTATEVDRYLQEKGFASACITAAIHWLQSFGYIDDQAFALAWVEERRRTKGRGRYALRHELQLKGIDDPTIEAALATISDEDERQLVSEWAHKRYERVKHLPWEQVERRVGSFLSRRGFPHSYIKETLRELRSKHENNIENESH